MCGLSVYDKKTGIDWKWQAIDGTITKAPLGGKMYRRKSNHQTELNLVLSIVPDSSKYDSRW